MNKDYRHGEDRWREGNRTGWREGNRDGFDSKNPRKREKPRQKERYDRNHRNEWKRKLEF